MRKLLLRLVRVKTRNFLWSNICPSYSQMHHRKSIVAHLCFCINLKSRVWVWIVTRISLVTKQGGDLCKNRLPHSCVFIYNCCLNIANGPINTTLYINPLSHNLVLFGYEKDIFYSVVSFGDAWVFCHNWGCRYNYNYNWHSFLCWRSSDFTNNRDNMWRLKLWLCKARKFLSSSEWIYWRISRPWSMVSPTGR